MTYNSWTYNDLTAEQFLAWANKNPQDWEEFFNNELRDLVYMLEQDDYFGTEGFDKRFA